jgi:hypothetical protein
LGLPVPKVPAAAASSSGPAPAAASAAPKSPPASAAPAPSSEEDPDDLEPKEFVWTENKEDAAADAAGGADADPDVVAPDAVDEKLHPPVDEAKEVSDDMVDAAAAAKSKGAAALEEKKYDAAILHFTDAIKANPKSALNFAGTAHSRTFAHSQTRSSACLSLLTRRLSYADGGVGTCA